MEGGFGLKSHDTWPRSLFSQNGSVFLSPLQKKKKTAPKHDVSSPMLHSRYGVLGMQLCILLPPFTFIHLADTFIQSDSQLLYMSEVARLWSN